jgi:putative transcriptional regulator
MRKSKLNKQFDKQFGLYIKKKRAERGWSQAELADKVDNNYQNISRLERGEITPTLFWCYKLAKAFEIELSDVIQKFEFKLKK